MRVSSERDAPDLAILDTLRGLAALYVMLGHAFGLLMASTSDPSIAGSTPVLASVGRGAFRWIHEAVLLFFVISGFCIHYRQASLLARPGVTRPIQIWSWFDVRGYGFRRFRRLFPPLALALAATAVFDFVGASIASSPPAASPAMQYLGDPSHSVTTFVGNLFFQPSFVVPPFGHNGALWSLAFEFWFYALYPVMLLMVFRLGIRALVVTACVASLIAVAVLPQDLPMPGSDLRAYQDGFVPWWAALVLLYWSVWVWGAIIAEAYARRSTPGRGMRLLAMTAVAIALVSMKAAPAFGFDVPWRAHDLLFGWVFTVGVAFVMVDPPHRVRSVAEALSGRLALLGDISYSLYVLHLPWIVLLSTWWLSAFGQLPVGGELMVLGAVSSIGLALGGWYFVERHFMTSRSARRASVRITNPPPQVVDAVKPATVLVAKNG